MKGADEYVKLFDTGQHDRLYLVSGCHARGPFFRIYVLPEGAAAIPNGSSNAPLNKDSVEVYGVISGNPGWTESYGWLHKGKWQEDFDAMVAKRKADLAEEEFERERKNTADAAAKKDHIKRLLALY